MRYRRRSSPLHATRPGVAAVWCVALGVAPLLVQNPLVIAGLGAIVLGAAYSAGVGRDILRVALFALPFALLWALLNPFLVREGLTVFARFGEVPVLGQLDLTTEALLYGARQGLRLLVSISAFGLLTVAVDPDGLLRIFRRFSYRSALSASIATRLVPVLAGDARRMGDAARCRADGGGTGTAARLAVLRAVLTNAIDRSLDVAATLEVRGYGSARRPPRAVTPWSRHDYAFAVSAVAVLALAAAPVLTGFAAFDPYDLDVAAPVEAAVALLAVFAVVILLPFADRRGIER